MHYQIFIPHQPGEPLGTAPQALERLGLADLIAGHEGRDSQGPGEHSQGHLIAWRRPGKNERMHFNAGEQTWIPSLPNGPDGQGRGRYWVGFWNDSPITPEDLYRPYAHAGPVMELGDGNNWRIPRLTELPNDYIRADDGTWKFEVQRQYHDLWLECEDWRERCFDPENRIADVFEVVEFCERTLRQNYRLLPEVTSHLRLFNSENVPTVLHAILGLN